MEFKDLIGETLEYVDQDPELNEILLTTKSGRRIMIYHEQNCCERVRIVDTAGNWHDLIGKVIVEVDELVEDKSYSLGDEPDDVSATQTILTFRVDDATIISRWIGESNGYYSETVDIKELT